MEIIKSTYPEGKMLPSSRTVVCELHFSANDIVQQGNKKVLVKNALPKVSPIDSAGSIHNTNEK